jgi:hypothetical protein
MEYFAICLPETLGLATENKPGEGTKLIESLEKCSRDNIYETKLIQTIVDFKWFTYTRGYFIK